MHTSGHAHMGWNTCTHTHTCSNTIHAHKFISARTPNIKGGSHAPPHTLNQATIPQMQHCTQAGGAAYQFAGWRAQTGINAQLHTLRGGHAPTRSHIHPYTKSIRSYIHTCQHTRSHARGRQYNRAQALGANRQAGIHNTRIQAHTHIRRMQAHA